MLDLLIRDFFRSLAQTVASVFSPSEMCWLKKLHNNLSHYVNGIAYLKILEDGIERALVSFFLEDGAWLKRPFPWML